MCTRVRILYNNARVPARPDLCFAGTKYHTDLMDNAYKTHMKLTIMSVTSSDYGSYQCISKNSLGDTDGTIKLYGTFVYRLMYLDGNDERFYDRT